MATLAEVEQHRTAVESVSTLAIAELASQWADLPDTPLALAGPLAELLVELYGDFSPLAATIAADFYEDLRDQASVPGSYTAVLAPEAPVDQIRASASWASSGAWLDDQKALRDAAAALDRHMGQRERDTMTANIDRDGSNPRYARIAKPDACAFCALLASRGAVYRSEATATSVGATRDERRQRQDDKYHDWCGCEAVPVWETSNFSLPDYATPWVEAYDSARADLPSMPDLKAVLAHMRANAGLR